MVAWVTGHQLNHHPSSAPASLVVVVVVFCVCPICLVLLLFALFRRKEGSSSTFVLIVSGSMRKDEKVSVVGGYIVEVAPARLAAGGL